MINEVMSPSSSSQAQPRDEFLNFTDAKTKKLALSFFSAICLFFGLTAFNIGPITALFVATPLLLGAALLAWTCTRIKDYANPHALQLYREAAKHQSLQETIAEHGWVNMIRYRILDPYSYANLYLDAVTTMSLPEMIEFYKTGPEAHAQNTEYCAVHPSNFKEQFTRETQKLNICQLFQKYTRAEIENFVTYKFFNPCVLEVHDEYLKAIDQKKKREQMLKNSYQKTLSTAITAYRSLLVQAKGATQRQVVWLSRLTHNLNQIEFQKKPIENAVLTPEDIGDLTYIKEATETFLDTIKKEYENLPRMLRKSEEMFAGECKTFNDYFSDLPA